MTGQYCDVGRLGLLGRTRSGAFATRIVVLPPGSSLVFDEREWRDCLVEVERGDVKLQLRGGGGHECRAGDVLWLVGLPILALHNPGCDRTVLVAVSRRRLDHLQSELRGHLEYP